MLIVRSVCYFGFEIEFSCDPGWQYWKCRQISCRLSVRLSSSAPLTFAVVEHPEGVGVLMAEELAHDHVRVFLHQTAVPAVHPSLRVGTSGCGMWVPEVLGPLQPVRPRPPPRPLEHTGRGVAEYYHSLPLPPRLLQSILQIHSGY